MRIAILTNAFPPDGRGGAEAIAALQAEGLLDRGHEVHVWAPESGVGRRASGVGNIDASSFPDATTQRRNDATIEVTRFQSNFHRLEDMNPLARFFFHLIADIGPKMKLVSEIEAWKPDVLLTHNLTGCGIGTPFELKKRGIRWIHTLHDVQLTDPSGRIRADMVSTPLGRAWRAFWSRYRGQYFFGIPDVLVSPTTWLLDWHANYRFKGMKQVVLPNPVTASPRVDERSLKQPATVLYVGRMSDDKGFGDLFNAIPMLDPEFVKGIVLIGGGAYEDEMYRLHDERVECVGWKTPEEVRNAMQYADVLIAPSRILENQQTILLEAMTEGTPVVATDVGGTRETLDGTGCPVLSIDGNVPRDIAKSVNAIAKDPALWHRLSVAMRERALRHDLERYLDGVEGLVKR